METIKTLKEKTGYDLEELQNPNRKKEVAWARHYLCHELRFKDKLTVTEIAKLINRHHSCVVNSCKKYDLYKL
jgi:chromosomal replication initiation ATPase DnaA